MVKNGVNGFLKHRQFIDNAFFLCYNSVNPYSGGIADAAKGDSGRLNI